MIGRTLPHRPEAEDAVLGGIMLRGSEALGEALEVISGEEDFYQPRAATIFGAMRRIDERGEPLDIITLEAELGRTGMLDLAGGIEGLARLDRHATAHNIKAHAEIVADAARVRNLVVATREIAEEGMEEVEDPDAFASEAAARIETIAAGRTATTVKPVRALVLPVMNEIMARIRGDRDLTGIPTGYAALDSMTAGLQPSDLIIIAARPSMGKTGFALNLAQRMAVTQQKHLDLEPLLKPRRFPVLIFSLEMSETQLTERLIASEARVDSQKLRKGTRVSEDEFRSVVAAGRRIADADIDIDDSPSPTTAEIRARSRRWHRRVIGDEKPDPATGKGMGAIMVDYMQLARGSKKAYGSREQEISDISRSLKALAKELKVPVIALSQLNRKVDDRPDHRPQLADLRESGAIEQDADVIMFIYREERYFTEATPEAKRIEAAGLAELIIGKQRNGPIGTVPLTYRKECTTFETRQVIHGELYG